MDPSKYLVMLSLGFPSVKWDHTARFEINVKRLVQWSINFFKAHKLLFKLNLRRKSSTQNSFVGSRGHILRVQGVQCEKIQLWSHLKRPYQQEEVDR